MNHVQDPIPQPDVPNGGASQKPSGDVQAWDPNRVVKILQHEDHYHVYTADGREFISYIDPRPYYPNAEFGQYSGSHDDQTARQNQNHDRQGQSVPRPQPDGGRPDANKPDGTKPNTQRQNPPKPNDRGQNTPKPKWAEPEHTAAETAVAGRLASSDGGRFGRTEKIGCGADLTA